MSADQVIYLVILTFCTVGSGFFSGSETAFIGISQERVHRLASTGRRGQRVEQLLADPERLLSTLLVANNLVNVLAAAVATTLFIGLVGEQWGPWLATAAVTAVILVFGEITPKTVAARYPERFVLAVAPSIWQLSRVLAPVAHFFAGITRGLLRLMRIPVDRSSALVTEEDIRALAELSHRGGNIEEAEREIIDALFGLADRPIREVMTPRLDMVTLTEPISMESVRAAVNTTGHSRFPVTGEHRDDIKGILYVKDLFQQHQESRPEEIVGLLRTPHYMPESATILDTLQQMRRRRFAFGLVLDEHGGVEGLLTAKDLLAELVGELQDEYDPGTPTVVEIDERTWLADGRLPLEDLSEAISLDLPAGPYSTAAGLFMATSGRVPEEGDAVDVDRIRLVVLNMDRNRIDRVRVEQRR